MITLVTDNMTGKTREIEIQAPQTGPNVAIENNNMVENVLEYGADKTGVKDSSPAFIKAMQFGEFVFAPTGKYFFKAPLEIAAEYKVTKIIGTGKASTLFTFAETDGIIVNKSGVTIDSVGIKGKGKGSGVSMFKPLDMINCRICVFDIGINLTNTVHIICAHFEKSTIDYNKSYGIKVVSGDTHQNNAIVFRDLYVVKNGIGADTLTTDATIDSGDGMMIDGGYSISIQNCVFEYNTGCGLRLLSNYHLRGCTIISPYFERNKYANFYIKNDTGFPIVNLSVSGLFVSEAGKTPVSNALTGRGLVITNPERMVDDNISHLG